MRIKVPQNINAQLVVIVMVQDHAEVMHAVAFQELVRAYLTYTRMMKVKLAINVHLHVNVGDIELVVVMDGVM